MEIAFSFSLLIRKKYNIDLMLPKLICHNIKLSLARHANDVYRSNQLTYSTGKTIFLTSKIDTNLIILEYKFPIITPYGLQISFSMKLNNFYFRIQQNRTNKTLQLLKTELAYALLFFNQGKTKKIWESTYMEIGNFEEMECMKIIHFDSFVLSHRLIRIRLMGGGKVHSLSLGTQ